MANAIDISVVGTGYVGLVTGVCLAYLGHNVTCVDTDESKINALCEGRSPIYEPGLDALLRDGLGTGRLRFTTDVDSACAAEVIFIAVGTPQQQDGAPDLRYVQDVARSVGRAIDGGSDGLLRVVVNKSTVPIGGGNWVEMLVREGQRDDAGARGPRRTNGLNGEAERSARFAVASNPEFLREGSAISDTLYPDRIVIGSPTQQVAEHGFELYAALTAAGVAAIECFPTASWTRWAGPRRAEPRSTWSTHALAAAGLSLPARRLSQDERDAIGAALTARAHTRGEAESFGDIVVPLTPRSDDARSATLAWAGVQECP